MNFGLKYYIILKCSIMKRIASITMMPMFFTQNLSYQIIFVIILNSNLLFRYLKFNQIPIMTSLFNIINCFLSFYDLSLNIICLVELIQKGDALNNHVIWLVHIELNLCSAVTVGQAKLGLVRCCYNKKAIIITFICINNLEIFHKSFIPQDV